MTELIDGKALSQKMQAELGRKVERLKEQHGIIPGLAVILVGDNPASQVYVRNKERSALEAGFKSETLRLSESISQEELIDIIHQYNEDKSIHGILVQLPLPQHINDKKIILAIDPKKDVDGFHPMNTGHLWSGRPMMVPCTPAGIMEMFREYHVDLEGKHAVIIGRSNIVGKPMAQLLLDKNATVTLTHSRTRNLSEVTKEADILIVAIGQGHFVTKDFVKEGAV
ncbi:TPA: tetrahydrofolate dehydrogenase/cyclohydrolase catalytic domain-containing protein, partial [Streptococcus agalactiae]